MDMQKKKSLAPNDDRISHERLVYKDNALIMASYNLSTPEQRLVLACIEKAQRKKEPLNSQAIEISLNVNEYADLFSVKLVTAYKALNEASNKLFDRSIKLTDERGTVREIRWLQEKAVYVNGRVDLCFSSALSRYISDIVTNRSVYRIEQATQLRSKNAIRFFEMFQMIISTSDQDDQGEWEVTVDRLKELLELDDNYSVWGDFKKRVIEECLKQINKNTSLKVSYEISEKDGRYIKSVKFYVFESSQLCLRLD